MLRYQRLEAADGAIVHRIQNGRCIRNLSALAATLCLCAVADIAWWWVARNLVLPLVLSGIMVALVVELRTVTWEESLLLQPDCITLTTRFVFKRPTQLRIPVSLLKSVLIYEALNAHSVRHCLGLIQVTDTHIYVAFDSLAPPLTIVQPIYQELLDNRVISAQLQKCKDD